MLGFKSGGFDDSAGHFFYLSYSLMVIVFYVRFVNELMMVERERENKN